MTQINLLPWREKLREEKKRYFFVALGISVLGAIVIMIFTHIIIEHNIQSQQQRVELLNSEIKVLNQQIAEIKGLKKEKSALISRMKIIQALQANRPLVVHLFDEMVKILPRGVFLTKVVRKADEVTLVGQAESNTNVSDLMRNIEASKWLRTPQLSEIKKQSDSGEILSEFNLQMLMINPDAAAAETKHTADKNTQGTVKDAANVANKQTP